jgi:hypothetical protein
LCTGTFPTRTTSRAAWFKDSEGNILGSLRYQAALAQRLEAPDRTIRARSMGTAVEVPLHGQVWAFTGGAAAYVVALQQR